MTINSWSGASDSTELDLTLELISLSEDLGKLDSRFRIARHEWDISTDTEMEAATFLKFEEKRFWRDFELYNFTKRLQGVQSVVISLVEELLIPLQNRSDVAFNLARTRIRAWKVFWDNQAEWEKVLDSL